ncbi:MAG: N utilization substance protein B, partial [Clostridia bacterium]|nr:N utilization substance protein B [Clostridia bacterium]
VNLVRKYSSEDSTRFVNGVLGTISRRQEKE